MSKLTTSISIDDVPNEDTIAAMKEVEDMIKNPDINKGYSRAHEMMEDILSEN